MSVFRLIIFDLDGTLVDSYPAIIASINYTVKKFGLPAQPADAIKRAVGWGDRAFVAAFVNADTIEKALVVYRRNHKRSLQEKSYFMPHARRLLYYLRRRRYMIAIASNRPRRFLNIILKHLRIDGLFDYVLCKDQIAFGKPHPSILNKIIRQANVAKENVLYVGDMAIDIKTGKRAKVATCGVCTGSSSLTQLRRERPDFLYRDLSPLFRIL